jgi:hypothetical protein
MGFSGQLDDLQQRATKARSAAPGSRHRLPRAAPRAHRRQTGAGKRLPGGGGRIEVRFVSDHGIQQHPVGELEQLLARDHGLVWVDIPVGDEEAARVLSEVSASTR